MIELDPRATALVLIDLQKGILALQGAPRPTMDVLATGKALATRFRAAGARVVLVQVGWAEDFADAPRQPVDAPIQPPPGGFPAGWSDLAEGLAAAGDIRIVKRHWGAFHGTELDLQLRRRGISTIVLGGVATNFGVESTARQAWERGYAVVLAEDACTSLDAGMHEMAITRIFPRISRVASSDGIGFAA